MFLLALCCFSLFSFLFSSLSLSSPFYTSRPCPLFGWPMVGCWPHHREEPFTQAQTWPLAAAVWKTVHRPHADHLLVREGRVADATNQTLPEPFSSPGCLCLALLHWGEYREGPSPDTLCFTHLLVLLSLAFVKQTKCFLLKAPPDQSNYEKWVTFFDTCL